jgi:hypothetical protein
MRLQAERLPDPMDRGRRMAHSRRHSPQAPLRGALGSGLQRLADGGGDLVIADLTWRAGTRLIIQPVHPRTGEAVAPLAGGVGADIELGRDLLVGQPACRGKHDARPHRQRLWRAMFADQRRQRRPLRAIHRDRHGSPLRHSRSPCARFGKNAAYLSIMTLGRWNVSVGLRPFPVVGLELIVRKANMRVELVRLTAK